MRNAEIKYFTEIARKSPPLRWGTFKPFKVTFLMRSPVCITTPWVNFDSLIAHLILIDTFGREYFILPRKLNLSQYLEEANPHRMLPIKKTGEVYHTSVSQFYPQSNYRVTQIYKRFEERWSDSLKKKKIQVGSGHFRAYAMNQVYIAANQVEFYVNGDMDIIKQLVNDYIVGLGNDCRIGFGAIKTIYFEETDKDYSLVKGEIAMRPIPVEMCEEYDEAVYLAYKGPYWEPRNVKLCVPPGARCKLKDGLA